ncbi:MAG: hypothetical protein LBF24_01740 [Puniceicoccales bacterium]|nr:hypothetical protein [Puniceicoccales bacterium]
MNTSMDFAAVGSATDDFYSFIDRSESLLYDRLCLCEDDAEIDELVSTITNMDRVDGCARALELKAVIDDSVAPSMALLAETCSVCMGAGDENVPWAELADLFHTAVAVVCAREGAQIDPAVLEEASMAVEERLAENRSTAERRAVEPVAEVEFAPPELASDMWPDSPEADFCGEPTEIRAPQPLDPEFADGSGEDGDGNG